MLRAVRDRLDMIRYHSAARPRTAWTRAADIILIASFFLALPVTWVCNAMVIRETAAITLIGTMTQRGDGGIAAALMMPTSGGRPAARLAPPQGKPYGNFELAITDEYRGWPLTTSIIRRPARLDIDILSEVRPRKNVALAADDPLRHAIEQALEEDDRTDALAAFQQAGPHVRQQWISWVIAAGLWWLMMLFSSSFALGVAKLMTFHVHRRRAIRRAARRAAGRCIACGYDLTGLDFNERCPECGEIVW